MTKPHILLNEPPLSLKHEKLARILTGVENILIIQDLDGVCMGLVKDPLTRVMDLDYVRATQVFDSHFYVLTNGEHIGKRGVNSIIDRAVGDPNVARGQALYLPGLAAGGVQWQDRHGQVTHPGVSETELQFLAAVPQRIEARLQQFVANQAALSDRSTILAPVIQASVLDNVASPTANLNSFYDALRETPNIYAQLQQEMHQLMKQLLADAAQQGLGDSFFVHYAPNLGRDEQGNEILRPATDNDSGTTDFQFMLRGAIKEAGVLAILNYYYFCRTGKYPLGADFSARQAPRDADALLKLVTDHFHPVLMPVMIGVGDTVNSSVESLDEGQLHVRRGGSDRNFLQLIQDIGRSLNKGNIVVYVDSSGGEVKNRKPVKLSPIDPQPESTFTVTEGPCDPQDSADPLTLNVVFPDGYTEYTTFFKTVADLRLALQQATH